MKKLTILAALLAVQMSLAVRPSPANTYPEFPERIDPHRSYVIFSHGRIAEGNDPRPVHERWGMYDFPGIVSKLAEDSSFVLIAYHRTGDEDLNEYVKSLEAWVRELTRVGVEPENITLVGFSRGGYMTALAASELKPMNINIALLGTCWESLIQHQPSVTLSGHLLSIYETTDSALSCKDLATKSTLLSSFEEVAISTGKEHGAFYTPLPDWVEPLLMWINRESAE